VSFGKQLSETQVENIRHYVVNRSSWTKENLPEMTAPTPR
jgi:quinohemoprotein ethanol dehydrogenase